jgi:tRNA threonylcarbamoyladenosine biosynthesis protein TsaE
MESALFDAELVTDSVAETEQVAARFFRELTFPAVVALYGSLGSGKTCFVRGVAAAAGIRSDEVSSPSFTLINEYTGGKVPIFHFDLYRAVTPSEFASIGGYDYLNRDGLVLIEWAENGHGFLPDRRHEAHFRIIDEKRRGILLTKCGL